jgi:6-phosphofructokinase 1
LSSFPKILHFLVFLQRRAFPNAQENVTTLKTLMVVSGGDAPGINATLLRYTTLAAEHGDIVVGAIGGFSGLLNNQIFPLTTQTLLPWAGFAGSYLQSSREPVLSNSGAADHLKRAIQEHQIDNLILFGGDGTLRHIPPLLQEWGIPCIGLPTTIDNDIPGTERTLGFDSACNYAYSTIDGIIATAHALAGRIFMVETLGGYSGFLAMNINTIISGWDSGCWPAWNGIITPCWCCPKVCPHRAR